MTDFTLQTIGSTPGAYEAKLAAGGWPNSSGHENYIDLVNGDYVIQSRDYHKDFTLTLAYLAANAPSRIHSHALTLDVEAANPILNHRVSETAVISAALSTAAGYKGAPGTTKAYVRREDGAQVWQDVPGIWLHKP